MTKLRETPTQLTLFSESFSRPFSEEKSGEIKISNVVNFDFSRRSADRNQDTDATEEKRILESVLSEARKLKW